MNGESSNKLILSFAQMLSEKQVSTKTIQDALGLLCNEFAFDAGLVYEIDQYNKLNLKEKLLVSAMPLREHFPIEDIERECQIRMAKEAISHVVKSTNNETFEKQLIELFRAQSIVVFSAVDSKLNIYGLLVFLKMECREEFSKESLDTLKILLTMLGSYMAARMHECKLAFARTSLENILDNTGIDIYVNDFENHDILYVNKSMAEPYGGVSQFDGEKCWKVLFPGQTGPCDFCPQTKLLDENGNPTKVYTWDYQRAFDGSWFRVFSAAFRWVDGRLAHVVSSADITDNKRNEELVQYMANYDSLTNLPNRRKLLCDCETLIKETPEDEKRYILFFDIDGFKKINDNYGHESGDEFLIKLGEFFTNIPMLKGAVYRNGGDEFVAILSAGTTVTNIKNLSHFMQLRFKKPWNLKKGQVYGSTSIGVSTYPDDGQTAEDLLYKADQAMYHVKRSGGDGICFGDDT